MDSRLQANRARWNELVPIHEKSDFYDIEAFRAGGSTLKPPEITALGDLRGKRVLHLQCHFGLDSLSLVRAGAEVTGVDFAPAAVEAAQRLSDELGLPARFVCADVLWLDTALNEEFDIVFASYGVLGWLPDIRRWARVAARFLRPDGRLCLAEFHPQPTALDAAEQAPGLLPRYSYFHSEEPDRDDEPGSYADRDAQVDNTTAYWWNHSLGDVVTAVVRAGLAIETLRELPRAYWPVFSFTEPDGEGGWRLRGGVDSVPLTYVLTARHR